MDDRVAAANNFIARSGWAEAHRSHLAGDASDRSYQRLRLHSSSAVFMDNPPGKTDDPTSFALIDTHLRALGLSAPEILTADFSQGFLLLEDLGDSLFARLLGPGGLPEDVLYSAALDVLLHLQNRPAPLGLPNLSPLDWASAAALVLECYAFAITGELQEASSFVETLADALSRLANGPRVLILRDYHAENLLWLPDRQGLARVGLLDFQLAQMGQPAYDLVSLLQDARRDVNPATEMALTQRFAEMTGQSLESFSAAYAVIGAQRALRILGIFARLCTHSGKPGYLSLIPRVWEHLQRNLAHPALNSLRLACAKALPAPNAASLAMIERQCATKPSR